MVECPNEGCKEKLTRRDMNNHKIMACVWREVSCEYCRGSFIVKNKKVCLQKYIPYIAFTRAASRTFAFHPKWKSGDDFQSLLSQDFVEL